MLLLNDDAVGLETDLGRVSITGKSIVDYLQGVHDAERLTEVASPSSPPEAPPTFCLSLYPGMTPRVELREDTFAMYGGHDIEVHRPIRAGDVLRILARINDVYEKSGRSGSLTVVVREVRMCDETGTEVVRVTERQIIRLRQDLTGAAE